LLVAGTAEPWYDSAFQMQGHKTFSASIDFEQP
jgi:hypothetical protein